MSEKAREERVLAMAPSGRDAALTCDLLRRAGLAAESCAGLAELCDILQEGAGVVVVAEEALARADLRPLIDTLCCEPPWSDVPIIVLTAPRRNGESAWALVAALGEKANLTLLERPVRPWTMLSAVQSALRARRRQYEVRDHLARSAATARELAAAKLSAERAREAAEDADRAKDHFLAVLSHELRTPLTPVLATASMLLLDGALDPELQESVEVIRRNAELEARLIDDLLDVTRIARGKIELNKRPVPICQVIQHAVDVCRPNIEARRLHFQVDICNPPHIVEADSGRIQQVFWNLINNAVKFTPPEGRVGVRCWRADHTVITEVSDNGIGIAPEVLPQLFRPFEQGGVRVTRQFGGLGLGLTISKALVEMHGGTIEARSDGKGKGATFRVQLPLAARHQPAAIGARPAPPVRQAAVASRPLRVLLVEDHADTAKIVTRLLTRQGYNVQTAGDVATALELAGRDSFDLLVSDLNLPDGSGLDVVRELRKRNREFPAIALSGFGHEEDVRRSREAGFIAHLTKPVNFEHLCRTIALATK